MFSLKLGLSAGQIFLLSVSSFPETPSEIIDELSLGELLAVELSSGSFLELDYKKSPVSMTIITSEMIKYSGARNMSELLEIFVPGFQYMYNKWNGTLWGMRGVANDRHTKLIYLVNGHKMNAQARDGFQGEVVLGLLNDIERVEVLRGPAGVIYGSGAIAGIVNVVTKKTGNKNAQVNTGFTTPREAEIDVTLFGSPSDNQKVSFSAGYHKSKGTGLHKTKIYGSPSWPCPGAPITGGVPSDGSYGSTDGNMRASFGWQIDNFDLYVRATRQIENAGGWFTIDSWPELNNQSIDSTAGNRTVDGRIIEPDDSVWFSTESFGENQRQYISDNLSAEGSYNFTFNKNILKIKCGFDRNTTRIGTEQRPGYSAANSRSSGFIAETFGESRFTLSTMFLLKSVDKLQFAAGMEYRLDLIGKDMEGKHSREEIQGYKVVSDVNYQTLSLFSEGFFDITDKFGIDLGGRLDFHTRTFMANPKIALVFNPWHNHFFKLIYQTASNNGSADNYEYNRNHFDPETGDIRTGPSFERSRLKPNSYTDILPTVPSVEELHSLKPEKVRSIELTSTHSIGDFFTITPSAALGQVTNLFGWSQVLFRVINAGKYNYGNFDLDCKLETRFIVFGGNHTLQRPVFTDSRSHDRYFIQPHYDRSSDTWYDTTSQGRYYPVSDGTYDTVRVNLVSDGITVDGRNFLNLSTNTTKFYLTVKPLHWIVFNTNLRLLWGLPGRKSLYDRDEKDGYNYLDIQNGSFSERLRGVPKKLNASLHFFLPEDITLSIFAYDILGIDRKSDKSGYDSYVINTIRWQQMANPEQKDIASTDQQSFGFTISKGF